ncbi:peptidylprolyl isomerase [Sandaracinus amylolyticus]|uniref:peptidylprolyl isomerase n=1 Tax=Sandaracinus amylolyticus TaxID=927083 RepID=UPI001F3D3A09|nr:peptidylprolyl isomerase [Sandaracinus amylolyticus]UJR80547.1 Peptidyl-prolyl cis-trans isomerase B [Sandaracinus amylolyticus]
MRRGNAVIAAVIALGGLWGCECETGATSGGEATGGQGGGGASATKQPTIGVTEDGEQIVFAGGDRGARSTTKQTPDRLVREPTEPDPEGGDFTLDEAVEGMPIDGQLVAEISTDLGTLFCDLYADRAPRTVANFVGLARGRRPWWDARAGIWRRQPYYANTTFHRVIPEFVVQGGDYLGDGSGTIGYTMPYEPHETLAHDRAGRLAMATTGGRDTGGAQFYILDGPAPQLDGTATVFGQCRPEDVVAMIARVPQSGDPDNRPLTPVRIARVLVQRVEGGAASARITAPQLPPGEPAVGRGASPGPSELRTLEGMRRRREEAAEQLREQRPE